MTYLAPGREIATKEGGGGKRGASCIDKTARSTSGSQFRGMKRALGFLPISRPDENADSLLGIFYRERLVKIACSPSLPPPRTFGISLASRARGSFRRIFLVVRHCKTINQFFHPRRHARRGSDASSSNRKRRKAESGTRELRNT